MVGGVWGIEDGERAGGRVRIDGGCEEDAVETVEAGQEEYEGAEEEEEVGWEGSRSYQNFLS